jgi:hypothetical protein
LKVNINLTYNNERRGKMALSEKARAYLKIRRKEFETEQYLLKNNEEPDDFLLRGYPFSDYISGKEKKKHMLVL